MDLFLRELVSFAAGGIGGAVVAVVALRTRLALMDVRMNAHEKQVEELHTSIDGRFRTLEKRQMLELQVLAGIARKVGVDGRFEDAVVRMLTGTNGPEAE